MEPGHFRAHTICPQLEKKSCENIRAETLVLQPKDRA